jgi:hypothetical protein
VRFGQRQVGDADHPAARVAVGLARDMDDLERHVEEAELGGDIAPGKGLRGQGLKQDLMRQGQVLAARQVVPFFQHDLEHAVFGRHDRKVDRDVGCWIALVVGWQAIGLHRSGLAG